MPKSENLREERIGTVKFNKKGSRMEVIEYNKGSDILVKFDGGDIVHASWHDFCKGAVRSAYDKTFLGVGYIGEGPYQMYEEDFKQTPQYNAWYAMLRRCYSGKDKAYKGCSVAEEWHNFQKFAEWYNDNYYELADEKTNLDKDILCKGNRVYSPTACIYVPQTINSLFVRGSASKRDIPIGVSRAKNNTFCAKYTANNKMVYLGYFDTIEEAFHVYKEAKEKHIKELAWKYRYRIPVKLYDALMAYKVEISD